MAQLLIFPGEDDLPKITQLARLSILPEMKKMFIQRFGHKNFPFCANFYKEKIWLMCQGSNCNARLKFQLMKDSLESENQIYKLESYNLEHSHGLKFYKFSYKADAGQLVHRFLSDLPEDMTTAEKKKYIQNRLPITNYVFYNAQRSFKIAPSNFLQLAKSLQAKGCHASYDSYGDEEGERKPDILVVSNSRMKNLYQKYGKCVSFDFTFPLINEKPFINDSQEKIDGKDSQYSVGFFSGVNQYNKTVIFGYAVSCKRDKDSIKEIFTKFFENNMERWPDSIVTDEDISFKYALEDIKKGPKVKTQHLLDVYHILKTKFPKEIQHQVSKVVMSTTEAQYKKNLYALRINSLQYGCIQMVDQLDSEKDKCCLPFISSYVGLNINEEKDEIIHKMLKNKMPYPKNYSTVVQRVLQFCKQSNQNSTKQFDYEKTRLDLIMNWDQLGEFSKKLCKTALYFLLSEITKSFGRKWEISTSQGKTIYKIYENQRAYQVSRSEIFDTFQCECNIKKKTDLLCSHIFFVCSIEKISFLSQLPSTWIVLNSQPVLQQNSIVQSLPLKRGGKLKLRRNLAK